MPTLHQVRLPAPTDWQELQRMTCDLYKKLWFNEDIQEFGSIGQRQNGVDVFGTIGKTKDFGGIQCKCGVSITPEEVQEEYEQSLGFIPQLSKYVIVTTSKRDAKVQVKAAELTKERGYRCTVVSWEDFCQTLSEPKHRDVLRKYYPDTFLCDIAGDSPGKLIKIGIDVNYYEILVSCLPANDKHYGGTLVISDLQNRKCITYRLGDHWSRLEGIVGITRCDAFLVSTWLNSFTEVGKLLRLGQTTVTYELTARERADAEEHGFAVGKSC